MALCCRGYIDRLRFEREHAADSGAPMALMSGLEEGGRWRSRSVRTRGWRSRSDALLARRVVAGWLGQAALAFAGGEDVGFTHSPRSSMHSLVCAFRPAVAAKTLRPVFLAKTFRLPRAAASLLLVSAGALVWGVSAPMAWAQAAEPAISLDGAVRFVAADAFSAPTTVPKKPILFDTAALDKTADPCADFYQYACRELGQAEPDSAGPDQLGAVQ